MYKIARAARQIFNSSKSIKDLAVSSMTAMSKYLQHSKEQGYIEDARDEFYFESFTKILPNQSVNKEQFKAYTPIFQNWAQLGSIGSDKILDRSDIRKLIYARFESEITYSITDEFNALREQGYDFAAARKAVQNHNTKSLLERMKELSISGFFSSYGGEPFLRENLKQMSLQKELVINEFMATITSRIEDPEEYSSELLG